MNKAKHTPGPWERARDGTSVQDVERTRTICKLNAHGKRAIADGDLIIAAPDLSDFANGVTDDLGFAEWATPEHAEELLRQIIDKWHPKGRAAIAKATGNSQLQGNAHGRHTRTSRNNS